MHKFAFDIGPGKTGDAVRGIGVYIRELSKRLRNVDQIDVSTSNLDVYDIVHFTAFNPFRVSVPFKKPAKTKFVITIYDLIPLIYPESYPPGLRGLINWQINKYLIKKNVEAVITISETSKKDICRFIGIKPEKVYVTHLASREVFKTVSRGRKIMTIRTKYNLPSKYALYVGDINFNKNIPNLVKACQIAKIPLVVVGKQAALIDEMDMHHPELRHLKHVSWKNVIKLGFLDDADLVNIYSCASVYVQPSFYEGFGLPLIEAYNAGVPIAVSKNQCHVEILGENFDYFDPRDIYDMAKNILNPNINKKITRKYDWRETAKETEAVYQKILN